MLRSCVCCILCLIASLSAWAQVPFIQPVTLEEPITVPIYPQDGEPFRAEVTGYTLTHLLVRGHTTGQLPWTTLNANGANQLLESLIAPRDAEGWARAAIIFARHPQAERYALTAQARAVRLDAELEYPLTQALNHARSAPTHEPEHQHTHEPPPEVDPLGDLAWPVLSDQEFDRLTRRSDRQLAATFELVQWQHQRIETEHFLLFSDLPDHQAQGAADLLERMYDRLLEMFNLPENTRIYAGKCPVLLFVNEADFVDYHQQTRGFDASSAAGLCSYFTDGRCMISAEFSADDELWTLHVLVHENVHGFLHRYRSRVHIPNWINEGLAEYIAHQLVGHQEVMNRRTAIARMHIEQGTPIDPMFNARNIEGWQYGLAFALTDFMVQGNRAAYIDFIHAIKNGTDWPQAMQQTFGFNHQQLLNAYLDEYRIYRP